jgi:hypothetical protein
MEIKNRKKIEVDQGSSEWLNIRKSWVGGASEAPAMMGKSKHFTRTQLIEDRLGIKKEFTDFILQVMEKGHVDEENARNVLEISLMEDFPPEVWQAEINGMILGASLDGGCKSLNQGFEHKSKNKDLMHNMKRNLLDEHYTIQLDQAILVSPYDEFRFICSDGTDENKEELIYTSTPEKLEALVAGWEQFIVDRDNFVFEPKAEKVEPTTTDQFPIVDYHIHGTEILTNFDQYKPAIEEISKHVFELIEKEDKTDLDFSNLDHYAKAGEKERKALKSNLEEVKMVFEAYAKFEANIKDCDSIIQKFSAAAKKSSKEAKEEIKNKIISNAALEIEKYYKESIKKISFTPSNTEYDFSQIGKGKKTIDSFKEAVNNDVARIKIDIKQKVDLIKIFDSYIREKSECSFLFPDIQQLVDQELGDFDHFKHRVNERIEDHKKREAEKIEQAKRDEEEKLKREAEELESFRKASSATIQQNNNKEEVVVSEMESTTPVVPKKENTDLGHYVYSIVESMYLNYIDFAPNHRSSEAEQEAWEIVCNELDKIQEKYK